MKENTRSKQQSINTIITAFKNAKVPLKLYKRNPVPRLNFVINSPPQRDCIYLHLNDKAKVKTNICRKNRQVLLTVTEPARKLHQNITVYYKQIKYGAGYIWTNYVTTSLPPETVYSFDDKPKGKQDFDRVKVALTADVPGSKMYFLVGFDEDYCFISRLPKKATTVKEAHEILMPPEVRGKDYIRQGEYFFIPFTIPKKKGKIDTCADNNIAGYYSTPHIADIKLEYVYNDGTPNILVAGNIKSKRHKTIHLPCVHIVYRNTEIKNNNSKYID